MLAALADALAAVVVAAGSVRRLVEIPHRRAGITLSAGAALRRRAAYALSTAPSEADPTLAR